MTTPDGVLSDQVLDRLRISAAMAAAVPQLAVQVRTGDTPCLEVRWAPAEGAAHRVLPPCAFHRAVTKAHRMRRAGERIAMRGVPGGCEPAIDWGTTPAARLLPGGVVRVDEGETWVHAAGVLGDDHHVIECAGAHRRPDGALRRGPRRRRPLRSLAVGRQGRVSCRGRDDARGRRPGGRR